MSVSAHRKLFNSEIPPTGYGVVRIWVVLVVWFFSSFGVVGQNGVTISSNPSESPTNVNPVKVTFDFDQPVNYFEESDINVNGGALSNFYVETPAYGYETNLGRLGEFRIHVTSNSDTGPSRKAVIAFDINKTGRIYSLTLDDGVYAHHSNGTADVKSRIIPAGDFIDPRDIALDSQGNIYIADSGNNRIRVYSSTGTFIRDIEGGLNSPFGVVIGPEGRIYVADSGNDRIIIYEQGGGENGEISGDGAQALDNPIRIAVDEDLNVYVNDIGNNRVQIFDSDGNYTGTISIANGDNIQTPGSIVVDEYGFIYIADLGNINFEDFLDFENADPLDLLPLITGTDASVKVFRRDDLDSAPKVINNQLNIPVDLALKPCGYLAVNNADAYFEDEITIYPPSYKLFLEVIFDAKTYRILPNTFTADFTIAEECEPASLNVPGRVAKNAICVDNSASNNFSIVWDETAPQIACLDNPIESLDENGEFILPNYTEGIIEDNCTALADLIIKQTPTAGTAITETRNITITAEDEGGNISEICPFQVIIEEEDLNEAPVAVADSYSTQEEVTLNVSAADGVLQNDTDAEGTTLLAELRTDVSNGTLTFKSDGSFTYEPNPGFVGEDEFTYVAYDGDDYSNEVTVTITVTAAPPQNTAPVAVADSYSTQEEVTLNVSAADGVLENDTDAEGTTLIAELRTDVSNGTLTFNSDGSFTYVPDPGFVGEDEFTYVAYDGDDYSNELTVTIKVTAAPPQNTAPFAVADNYSIQEEVTLNVSAVDGVLENDTDAEGTTLLAELRTDVSNGTLTFNSDGSFTYVPEPEFVGEDGFTYVAYDSDDYSNEVTVTITVTAAPPQNTAPVAVADSYSTQEEVTLNVSPSDGVLENDTDEEGTTLIAELRTDVSNGTLTFNSNGSFTYVPDPGFVGEDGFTYVAYDGDNYSNEVTVTITVTAAPPQNTAPVAVADNYSTQEEVTLNVSAADGVLENDTDAEGTTLLAELRTDVSNGTLTFNSDGSFTYEPDPGFVGEDEFTYVAYDGDDISNVATVTITINEDNTPLEISCPVDQEGILDDNCSFEVPDYRNNAGVNSPDAQIVQQPAPGTIITERTSITLTATLGEETDSCSFELVLIDNQDPVFTCIPDQNITFDPEVGYTIPDYREEANPSDNCDFEWIQTPAPNTIIYASQTIEISATDAAGNRTWCSFIVRLTEESEELEITCPENQSTQLDANCEFLVPDYTSLAIVNIPDAIMTQNPPAGSTINSNTSISLIATSGNQTVTCEFQLILEDIIAPTVVCPPDQWENYDPANDFALPDYRELAITSDACGIAQIQQSPSPGINITQNTTVSLSVTDLSGNSITCAFTVNLTQEEVVEISCPEDQVVETLENCSFTLRDYTNMAGVNFEGAQVTQAPAPGTQISGNTTVILTATLNGQTDSCAFDVYSEDNTAPVANCIATGGYRLDQNGNVALTAEQINNGSTDNCGIVSMELNRSNFTTADIGDHTIMLTVKDAAGNTDSCETTISIWPYVGTGNEFTCKTNFILELDETGNATLSAEDLYTGDPQDRQFSLSKTEFNCENIGDNNVTLSYIGSADTGSCDVIVQVKDSRAPTIIARNITVTLDSQNQAIITPQMVDNGTSDNCSFILSLDQTVFGCKEMGEKTITLTGIDSSGNSATATAVVTVIGDCDDQPIPVEGVDHIFIYPNPTPGPFKFATPTGMTIDRVEAFDARGRFIVAKTFDDNLREYQMDLTGVEQAVYFLKIFSSDGVKILRVIIK